MANEQRPQQQAGEQRPARDRKRDVESLAATIFAQRVYALGGQYDKAHIAADAVEMARVFYAACDAPPAEKPPESSAPPG